MALVQAEALHTSVFAARGPQTVKPSPEKVQQSNFCMVLAHQEGSFTAALQQVAPPPEPLRAWSLSMLAGIDGSEAGIGRDLGRSF